MNRVKLRFLWRSGQAGSIQRDVNEANRALADGLVFALRRGSKTCEVSRFATGEDDRIRCLTVNGWLTVGDEDEAYMIPLPMQEPKASARNQ